MKAFLVLSLVFAVSCGSNEKGPRVLNTYTGTVKFNEDVSVIPIFIEKQNVVGRAAIKNYTTGRVYCYAADTVDYAGFIGDYVFVGDTEECLNNSVKLTDKQAFNKSVPLEGANTLSRLVVSHPAEVGEISVELAD